MSNLLSERLVTSAKRKGPWKELTTMFSLPFAAHNFVSRERSGQEAAVRPGKSYEKEENYENKISI